MADDSFFDNVPSGIMSEGDWKSQPSTPHEATSMSEPTENAHRLRQGYTFWYMRRLQSQSVRTYEKNIKVICSFNTVEDFWACYNHIIRPGDLPFSCDFHLFREGVKPMWEDDENKEGGKFVVTIPRKKVSSKFWEDLLLAIIGAQFAGTPDDEICGAVISTRYNKDIISVWTKRANSEDHKELIHQKLKKIFGLPPTTVIEFKAHDVARSAHEVDEAPTNEDGEKIE